jgi:hypothetical protein
LTVFKERDMQIMTPYKSKTTFVGYKFE